MIDLTNGQTSAPSAARHTRVPIPPWKRALDITCCATAMPALALWTFFVAVLMKTSSPGTIFFRQERVGYGGRRFKLYKFRTMHVGADTATHQSHFTELVRSQTPMQKLDARHDSRLIPGGWLLRASGLDELPQIINVLRGDMSLVGPRPCIPYEYEQFSAEQRKRFNTAPGLTGLWQVSGKNKTTFERMVQLDIDYIERRSLWLDLKIIVLTLPTLALQIVETRRARATQWPSGAAELPATAAAPLKSGAN